MEGQAELDYNAQRNLHREPCPSRIWTDCGGAFAMGAIGGSIFHGVKGFRNSPPVRSILCVLSVLTRCSVLRVLLRGFMGVRWPSAERPLSLAATLLFGGCCFPHSTVLWGISEDKRMRLTPSPQGH